jgi:hypothetical protein
MTMDAETQKDAEHLLDDQLPNIRRAYEEAVNAGSKDPVIWLFNLELDDSREVAISIFGERLREQLNVGEKPEAIRSCLLPTEKQMAIECLAARLPSTGVSETVGAPQKRKTIRVLVFFGGDIAAFDVPRSGKT